MTCYRLLMVEDNPADVDLIKDLLEEEVTAYDHVPQFKIQHCPRLDQALEVLGNEEVDAVLLDLHLLDSDGLSTLKRLREMFPDLPVVVMTGLEDKALAKQALKLGATAYLDKGVDLEHSVLSECLGRACRSGPGQSL